MSRPASTTPGLLAAEAALAFTTLAAAFGFTRIFAGWDWLPTLALATLGSHLLATAVRRLGWNLAVAAVLSGGALVLFVTLGFYGDTTRWLVVPTAQTWDLLGTDVRTSFETFATAVAPVPADPGFLVVAAIAVWVAAFLADGFAFRAAVVLESLVPTGLIFVFCSALAGERFRILSAALFLGTAALTVALLRSLHDEAGGWLTGHRAGVAAAALRVGSVLAVVATLAAVVVGPALPGYGEEALVDTRQGGGTRQTFSPLVDIRGRISERSEDEAFRVGAERAAYWRLTALDQFDGETWISERTYGDAGGDLGGGVPVELTTPIVQEVTIANLDTLWLPAAFSPRRVTSDRAVRYDEETASLVVRRGTLEPGMTYTVVSQVPDLTPEVLDRAVGAAPPDIASAYLGLPEDFPESLRQQAQAIVAGAGTPYQQARRIQDWFSANFTYDLNVPSGASTNAIERFLESGRGYCEQFAGTFAAFARAVGIPSRVAVGFTWGDLEDGEFVVRGKHAHAWPEVYLTGIGWVAFEPTPSRGLPGAEAYTGIPAAQEGEQATDDPGAGAGTTVPESSTATTVQEPFDPGLLPPIGDLSPGGGTAGQGGGVPGWLVRAGLVVLVAALAVAAWLVTVPRLVRRRWARRRAAASAAGRVLIDWHRACWVLERAGQPADRSATPLELAERVASMRGASLTVVEAFPRLADAATVAAYAPGGVPEATARETEALCHEIEAATWRRAGHRTRLRWLADPRPLVQPLPDVEAGERRPVAVS